MSLQVWLPLNGNLKNQGLSNIQATNFGATINNTGKIGKCYYLGTNNKITVPFPDFTTEFSICFWMKRNSDTGTRQFLYTGWNGITCELQTAGQIIFGIYTTTQKNITVNGVTATVEAGWQHFCGTYKEDVSGVKED